MKNLIKIFALGVILLSSCSTNAQLTDASVNKIGIYANPVTNLKPKWYAPQQSISTTITPMVTPQFIFQGENGRGYSGPGLFGNN
jgi:hypothetical protein